MHVRSAFFTVHCTKEWYLNSTHGYKNGGYCRKFMYTGVIMPRIPAPPLIQGGSKYKIQYEFHVNIKHKIHNVLNLLSLKIRARVNTIQCEFHVNIKQHRRSTPVLRTYIWMHRREYLSRTCRHLHIHICTHVHAYAHNAGKYAHTGTNNTHAWLISVSSVSSISGASEGPPHVPNSDFGKLKLLLPLLLFVSEITSQRSDFIIVSFRLVGTLLS